MKRLIDIFVLTRTGSRFHPAVLDGIKSQRGVRCSVFQVVGRRENTDANRHQTIVRARNRAKKLGNASWAMYLDDDVVLEPDCAVRLLEGLKSRPDWGALAADYLEESRGEGQGVGHVGMGATLFRRDALERIQFRWEPGKCECRCCCEDLSDQGYRIGYLPAARAHHQRQAFHGCDTDPIKKPRDPVRDAPHVLAALDSNHFPQFYCVFLKSFRATGNRAPVTVIGYGLSAGEKRVLARHPSVARVVSKEANCLSPAVRRVKDFQLALTDLPDQQPVVWWDAGDVLFQRNLGELWDLLRANPGRLLAVREPESHPRNTAVAMWTSRIADLRVRENVFQLLSRRPFLNSGFVAGDAQSIRKYLRFAKRFLDSADLWDQQPMDQLAFNYYCHSDARRWVEVDQRWNYCLAFRGPGLLQPRRPSDTDWHPAFANLPRFVDDNRRPIPVVHGNARMLQRSLKRWWADRSWSN